MRLHPQGRILMLQEHAQAQRWGTPPSKYQSATAQNASLAQHLRASASPAATAITIRASLRGTTVSASPAQNSICGTAPAATPNV